MKANGVISEQGEGAVLHDPLYSPSVPSISGTTQYLQTYEQVNWVYACAKVKGMNLAQLPLKIYTGIEDEKVEITSNPAFDVWKKPSPFHSRQNFWMAAYGYLDMAGENFIYLMRDSENQPPRGMIQLRPDRIEIVADKKEYIKGYIYRIGGQDIPFQPWEIYYVRYFNPVDDYRGLSPIRAFANDIILELNSVHWAKDFFKSGAKPSGLLKTPDTLDEVAFKRLEKQFRDKYTGADSKAQGIIILEGESDFTPFSMNPRDAEFLKQREFSKDAIMSALGVPPIMIMDLKKSSVLQNTEVQRRLFWTETLRPMYKMYEELINTDLMPLFGVDGAYVEFDVSKIEALKEDRNEKAKRYFEGFKSGGVTPNDIVVDVFGKEAIDDPLMNSYFLPINQIPVAQSKKAINAKPAKRSIQIEGIDVTKIVQAKFKELDEKEIRQALWRSIIVKADVIETGMKYAIQKLFREQREVILEWWDNQDIYTETKQLEGQLDFFDEEFWIKTFNETALPYITEAVTQGGNHALESLDLIDEVFNIQDPAVQQHIADRLDLFGTSVNGTTRDAIAETVANGMNNNESIADIKQRLEHVFDVAERSRAGTIARTEATGGFNFGNLEGMIQSKLVEKHEWLTVQDEVVRESHMLDGVQVMLGEPFPVGADYQGWTSTYPCDYNERCVTIPVRINPL